MNFKTTKLLALALGLLCLPRPGQARAQEAPAAAQRTFPSPYAATNALLKAAKAHDHQAMRELFGPEITNLWTGDKTLDEKHFEAFASDLEERCDAVPEGTGRLTLEIGPGKWPFPIPLIQTNGVWVFDTIAGEEEIINRHIGRDEYHAIGVCREYVTAQREFAKRFAGSAGGPKYARRFKSTPGKTDGLYWPAASAAGKRSPLSSFVAQATYEGYNWKSGKGPRSYHGYLFKILTRQGPAAPGGRMNYIRDGQMTGGFAMVAYPVRWGESGVMTFMVNQDGIVYQRSLGEKTPSKAASMKEYNPDGRWSVVQEPGIVESEPGSGN